MNFLTKARCDRAKQTAEAITRVEQDATMIALCQAVKRGKTPPAILADRLTDLGIDTSSEFFVEHLIGRLLAYFGDRHSTKLTRKEITQAIARYARRHGYYARTVRDVSSLFYAAIREYQQ